MSTKSMFYFYFYYCRTSFIANEGGGEDTYEINNISKLTTIRKKISHASSVPCYTRHCCSYQSILHQIESNLQFSDIALSLVKGFVWASHKVLTSWLCWTSFSKCPWLPSLYMKPKLFTNTKRRLYWSNKKYFYVDFCSSLFFIFDGDNSVLYIFYYRMAPCLRLLCNNLKFFRMPV